MPDIHIGDSFEKAIEAKPSPSAVSGSAFDFNGTPDSLSISAANNNSKEASPKEESKGENRMSIKDMDAQIPDISDQLDEEEKLIS